EAKTPVFQGATENEVGALLKLSGLRWAHGALDLPGKPFDMSVDEIHALLQAGHELPEELMVQSKGKGVGSAYASTGIGQSIDAYLGLKLTKDVKEFFDALRDYLVSAGEALAKKRDWDVAKKLPAIAALSSKKGATEGLDAAVLEILNEAEILPNGKV